MAEATKGAQRTHNRHAERRRRSAYKALSAVSGDDILVYGTIDQWGDVSARDVNERLVSLGKRAEITVRINSGGGSVTEGYAIYNMLKQHGSRVVVNIEGAAFSIATVIACAGDEIRMAENALYMIHDPTMWDGGDAKTMRKNADLLDKTAEQIRDIYVSRTGLDAKRITRMMAEETWLDADEALELGFITEIVSAKRVAAMFDPDKFLIPGRFINLFADVGETGESPLLTHEDVMNDQMRKLLVALGMDESLSDSEATTWMADNSLKMVDEMKARTSQKPAAVVDPPPSPAPLANTDELLTKVGDLIDSREKARTETRDRFVKEINANLELAFGDDVPETVKADCMAAADINVVRAIIKDARAKSQDDVRITFARTQPRDRHFGDISTAFQMRAMQSAGIHDTEKYLPTAERGKNWQNFSQQPLLSLCRECLLVDGYSEAQVSRLSYPDLAKAAFGFPKATSLRNDAIHVTGTLPKITMDALNKSLLAGYEESPATWRGPMRQAASVPDFKDIHRIRLGAAPNLPVWPDNVPAEEAKVSDQKVTYAVEARAEKISFSWRLFVNDDMDALARIPRMLGDAAARTVNAVAWAQITSNPTMPYDSVALFAVATGSRKRTNLITGAGAPTNTTLGAMTTFMRLMRGINTPEGGESQDILNLSPKFFVVPAALEIVALQLVKSTADPAASGNAGIFNPANYLIPVVEPLLDASSTTAYYLFADPARVDTVEVSFLQGQETPATYDWIEEETLSRNVLIVQTFQAQAIDHRGMVKHAGA